MSVTRKHSSGDEAMWQWKDRLSEHQLSGWIAFSADRLQGEGAHERIVLFTDTGMSKEMHVGIVFDAVGLRRMALDLSCRTLSLVHCRTVSNRMELQRGVRIYRHTLVVWRLASFSAPTRCVLSSWVASRVAVSCDGLSSVCRVRAEFACADVHVCPRVAWCANARMHVCMARIAKVMSCYGMIGNVLYRSASLRHVMCRDVV